MPRGKKDPNAPAPRTGGGRGRGKGGKRGANARDLALSVTSGDSETGTLASATPESTSEPVALPSTPVRSNAPRTIFPPPHSLNDSHEVFNLNDISVSSSDDSDMDIGNTLKNQELPSTPTPQPAGQPAIFVSPIKRKMRGNAAAIVRQTDLQVWNMEDNTILEASKVTWKSNVYNHFNVSLKRVLDDDGLPKSIQYVFTCKNYPEEHVFTRTREAGASTGTSNMWNSVSICQERHGVDSDANDLKLARNARNTIPYSDAAHRTLIAMRCARNKRPFNSVEDEEYKQEVDMLRPGTIVPSGQTVSRDVNILYKELSVDIRTYFTSLASTIHLVLDGWTAPILTSYLGLVVVWCTEGKIHRQILEFIRLTKSHDGFYLAKMVSECIKRFQLEDLLFTLCMDNASNCDRLALVLPQFLSKFRGMQARARCFAHIINLIAKIFISFFFKRPKPKKTVKFAAANASTEREEVIEEGEDDANDPEVAIAMEELEDEEKDEEDDGRVAHDKAVVRSMRDQAVLNMKEEGVFISKAEEEEALKLFPKVSGLARRVHDSPTLYEEFERHRLSNKELEGDQKTLTRRVATRWNSDFACLKSHLHFKEVVKELTSSPRLKLGSYALNARLWDLAEILCDILDIFDNITNLFSKAEVPLVVEVLPMLQTLEANLKMVRDDETRDLDDWPVVRIAAEAALLLIKKYSILAGECELYYIALLMCPDRKMKWFEENGYDEPSREKFKQAAITCFNSRYAKSSSDVGTPPQPASQPQARRKRLNYEFKKLGLQDDSTKPLDTIERYLADPVETTESINTAGGYIEYWTRAKKNRPLLAKMALDFCSVPASSVDAERAFSHGRLQVNHLQHNMNSQTFKAQIALGSWVLSPAFPGFERACQVISDSMHASSKPSS